MVPTCGAAARGANFLPARVAATGALSRPDRSNSIVNDQTTRPKPPGDKRHSAGRQSEQVQNLLRTNTGHTQCLYSQIIEQAVCCSQQ